MWISTYGEPESIFYTSPANTWAKELSKESQIGTAGDKRNSVRVSTLDGPG
jgi:hypothetical protein